jgi:hypothetical protein
MLPDFQYLPENRFFFIGQAFAGYPIALRHSLPDGCFDIFFAWKRFGSIDLHLPLKSKCLHNPLLP